MDILQAKAHHFNPDDANKYGVVPAVILFNIEFWCEKNYANKTNIHDGMVWTYNSVRAWQELFPYLSKGQIDRALCKLEESGALKSGNFNQSKYDRTKWYAPISLNQKLDFSFSGNGVFESEKPIPNINTDINTDNTPIVPTGKRANKFVVPTADEVAEYCSERNNSIDAEEFVDFYESKGWMVGKNKMKCWKACVRTWERNAKNNTKSKHSRKPVLYVITTKKIGDGVSRVPEGAFFVHNLFLCKVKDGKSISIQDAHTRGHKQVDQAFLDQHHLQYITPDNTNY